MKSFFTTALLAFALALQAQDSTYSLKMKFTGHTRSLEAVAFSPDGKWIASGGWDNELHIYRADTPGIGNLKYNLTGHLSAITCVAYSKDGSLVASGSNDFSVRVYKTEDGSLQYASTEHTGAVTRLLFDPTGKFMMSSAKDGTIRMYNLFDAGAKVMTVNYGKPINSFVVAANAKTLYVATSKGEIDNIGFRGAVLKSLAGHTQQVNCMELSPNGKWLATGSDDKSVLLWDLAAGTVAKTLTGHTWKVTSVTWSSDGKYLASTCNDGGTMVWDVESGKSVSTLNAMGTNARSVSFSADLSRIAVATVLETSNHGAIMYNTPLRKSETQPPVAKDKRGVKGPVKGAAQTGNKK